MIGNSITTVLPGHEPQTFAFDQIMGPSTSQDDVFNGERLDLGSSHQLGALWLLHTDCCGSGVSRVNPQGL